MELTTDLLFGLLTALALGALIGAEREMSKAKEAPKEATFAGLRTYSLVAILGFVGAYLSTFLTAWILIGLLVAVTGFFLADHLSDSKKLSFFGLTSEITALLTFLMGVTAFYEPLLAVILGVITVLLLTFKSRLHQFIQTLEPVEFLSAIKFIIVAFVVLPLLPAEPIDPWGLISLANAWLVVVLVSAISFIGYILVKAIGTEKGLGLMALVGGLASSTATTISIAQQGHKSRKIIYPFVFGIIITSMIMFGRALVEVALVNRTLLPELSFILGGMIAISLIILLGLWLLSRRKKAKTEELELNSPFRLWPAVQFGLLYLSVLIISEFANRYFGQSGVYVASVISGLADIDAITLSLSNLSAVGKLETSLAAGGITLAVMVNTLVKLVYVGIFGHRRLFLWTAGVLLPILMTGMVLMVFL